MNFPLGLRVLLESMHFQLKFASSAIIGGTKDEIYLFSQKAPLPRPFSQAGQSQSTNTPLHYPSQRGSGEYPSACPPVQPQSAFILDNDPDIYLVVFFSLDGIGGREEKIEINNIPFNVIL